MECGNNIKPAKTDGGLLSYISSTNGVSDEDEWCNTIECGRQNFSNQSEEIIEVRKKTSVREKLPSFDWD